LSVYPNPVKNKLFVELANERVTEINVIDYAGRIVKTINGNVNTVNVSDLTRGIYILKIATENGVSTTRFVKQ
ncbi:MAG: T9SS type A sorting domain-containing protein, partial [Flavobacteriales bacterium]|nr:T9SS type A sorting domain-containing protein [Flavobacteriales bacterium]